MARRDKESKREKAEHLKYASAPMALTEKDGWLVRDEKDGGYKRYATTKDMQRAEAYQKAKKTGKSMESFMPGKDKIIMKSKQGADRVFEKGKESVSNTEAQPKHAGFSMDDMRSKVRMYEKKKKR